MLAKLAQTMLMAQATDDIPLSWNEALSGIFGSISLACWIFVFIPQLWENFTSKSAAGLSLGFVTILLLGDVTNFVGAVLAGLIPTVVALSVWYILADGLLVWQVLYYGFINSRKNRQKQSQPNGNGEGHAAPAAIDEQAPLLRRSSFDVPGSRRRSSTMRRTSQNGLPVLEESNAPSTLRSSFNNVAAILALVVVGTAAWAIAYASGAWKPTPAKPKGDEVDEDTLAVVLGYISAVCYLGARIPQIIKNFRDKSCEGLSLLFFILSMVGNLTYGAQIFFHSLEKRYLLTNLPWLLGSVGTIAEDLTIFAQFRLYKKTTAVEITE